MRVELNTQGVPTMVGDTPSAKAFNERVQKMAKDGRFLEFTQEAITLVLVEMLLEDYDKRNKKKAKAE